MTSHSRDLSVFIVNLLGGILFAIIWWHHRINSPKRGLVPAERVINPALDLRSYQGFLYCAFGEVELFRMESDVRIWFLIQENGFLFSMPYGTDSESIRKEIEDVCVHINFFKRGGIVFA